MLRPGMEAFKGNKIFQCQMGIEVPQSNYIWEAEHSIRLSGRS
jgi:hypothetical protein